MDIVEVEWEDSAADDGWCSTLVKRKKHIRTWGAVMQDDEEGMALVFGLDPNENSGAPYLCPLFIPRSAIRKVTKLGPKRGK